MGKITIEYEGKLTGELLKRLTGPWNVQGRDVRPKVVNGGSIICSRLTYRAICETLRQSNVLVKSITVYESNGSTKTIFWEDGNKRVARQAPDLPWRLLQEVSKGVTGLTIGSQEVFVYQIPSGKSEREKKEERVFFDKLNRLDPCLKEGLYSVLTTIVDELNPALSNPGLRQWHFVSFPPKTAESTPAVLLQPLENKAPGLYTAAVGYVQTYQEGLGTYISLGRNLSDRDAVENYMLPIMQGPQDQLETSLLEVMMDGDMLKSLESLIK